MKSFRLVQFYSSRLVRSEGIRGATTKPVIRIAIAGIVLGTMAMLISMMVVTGFRNEIVHKITGFVSDYRITAFNNNASFEESPLLFDKKKLEDIRQLEGVRHIQSFSTKAGLIKADEDIQGVVLKGVDSSFEPGLFKEKLVQGKMFSFGDSSYTKGVLISENIAKKLNLKIGDSFLVFFIHQDKKVRKLFVEGIYNTGLSEEFDNLYVLCDMRLIQQVNNWDKEQVGGYEVFAEDGKDRAQLFGKIYHLAGYELNVQSTRELYPQLFNWLEMLNLNVYVIIGLIIFTAAITMTSTLLVLVMENAREVGILKALGASDGFIGRVFGTIAFYILLKGVFIGNVIALGLAWIQIKTGILSLPVESYYLSKVPVNITLGGLLLINGIVILTGALILLIPAKIVAGINPIRVFRFD